jgi:hypothetical protein
MAEVVKILTIPTAPGVPFYTQRTRLDGREYLLRFSWNEREERWYLAIADEAEVVLVLGIKLVANWPLTRFYKFDPRLPPGELMVSDLTGTGTPPGLDDLGVGKRCELTYFAVTEQ